MNLFYGMLLGILIYSVLSTVIIILTNENDTVMSFLALGIFGSVLLLLFIPLKKLIRWNNYHKGKRSIFIHKETGEKWCCKTKYTDNIYSWQPEYKLIKRYAKKNDWKSINEFPKDVLTKFCINCDNCKYDTECSRRRENVKCQHDLYGVVTTFDKFEWKDSLWR